MVDSALGGDYWDVPFPALVEMGQDRDCYLEGPGSALSHGLGAPPIDGSRHRYLSYLVRTEPAGARIRVELRDRAGKPIAIQRPRTQASFSRWSFDLSKLPPAQRKRLRVWFVAEHGVRRMGVDDLRLWRNAVPARPITTPTKTPDGVWGFADLHTHPAAHLGYGGQLIFGAPNESFSRWAQCRHGAGHVNQSLLTEKLEPAGHAGTGTPEFEYWPRFNSVIHQQLHEKWLRRAWRGGLRLIVFHAVNNALIGRYFHTRRSDGNDMVSAKKQLRMMRAWVKASDFMEVARTPADARRIAGSGRLAVVLGVEVDSLGGCHEHPGLLSEQGVPPNSGCNERKVRRALDDLFDNYDVRHVFPVHLADNDFGGTALYSLEFAKFSAWFRARDVSPTDAARPRSDPRNPVPHVGIKLNKGWDFVDDFLLGLFANMGMDQKSWNGGPHVNNRRLTRLGRTALDHMWKRGMVVELDHMSELTARDALGHAELRGVPMVAGHTAPRELMFVSEHDAAESKIAAENNKSDAQIARLHRGGGVMGIGTGPVDIERGPFAANDCSGSSQTWLSFYLHTARLKSRAPADMPGFVGIGLGTDMHMQAQLYPRFGVWACMGRDIGVLATAMDKHRKMQAADVDAQADAVSYRSPAWTYYSSRFQRPIGDGDSLDSGGGTPYMGGYYRYPTEAYGGRERAVWHGLLLASALRHKGIDPLRVDLSSQWNWWHWVDGARHFALGFAQSAAQSSRNCRDRHPTTGRLLGRDGCALRRAAFLVKSGRTRPDPADGPVVRERTAIYIPMIVRVWTQYQRMVRGGNPSAPLQRCEGASCAGSREFDYNIDGLAHYGLIPDFLQDAANQLRRRPSRDARDLRGLFRSAEDYIRMWEKVWANR